ncbi:hypothetical protein [Novispirillum itersonii]|uniref:Uncharacterized protein n=1 Tax=Novispirillum itersonii TaxID=189 RepID=A0A7W9ZJ83_NOVIT|nr:hypothetical protein [Novispirillum itersonii]MBB6212511.1 hypothetical protein [Novispirillum itersonii]
MQKSLSAALFAVSLLLAGATVPPAATAQTAAGAKAVAPATPATGQTQTTPPAQPGQPGATPPGTMDELNAIVKIQSRPKTVTPLPENQPVQLDLSLVNVPEVPKPLLEGVTGNAFARYVSVDNKLVGQMVLAGVSKDGRIEALDTSKFAAQFPLKATTLSTDEPVVIEGDKVQLIEALKRLQKVEEVEKKKKEEKETSEKSSTTSNANGMGSRSSANPDAAGYTTPQPGTLTQKETTTSVEVVEDGCPIRVDVGQGVAIQQNRTVTVSGDSRSESPCEDGGTRYQISKTYQGCTYAVDLVGKTATARYSQSYTGPDGTVPVGGGCTEDPEKVFQIVEQSCGDQVNGSVTVTRARLMYRNHLNTDVEVQPCAVKGTREVTASGCPIRIDAANLVAIQQTKIVTVENNQKSETPCEDGGTRYPIAKSYQTCPYVVNVGARTATAQFSMSYTGPNGSTVAVAPDCSPDPEKVYRITEQSCPVLVSGGLTTLQSKLQYRNHLNTDVEVQGCTTTETREITEQGCPVRIDTGKLKAIQQTKTVTTIIAGNQKSETACEDSETSFPLLSSYLNCTYRVDLTEMTATARSRFYYVNKNGDSVQATDCANDNEKVFPITEDVAACPIKLDFDALKAIPQATLTYTNHLNAKVQVRDCMDSKTVNPVPLVATTDGCTIRHDFAAGKSTQQGGYKYTLNKVIYDAVLCSDTEATYPHSNVYDDAAGGSICNAIIRQDNRKVYRQYRTQIIVGGQPRYITECTPDTTALDLYTTQEGCESPSTWVHDLSAGVSYASVRDYYMRSGRREYINSCHTGSQTYPHQITAAGWEMNDGNRTSIQKSRVFINAPTGQYVINTSTILPGTTAIPYEYVTQTTSRTGQSTYEGCTAWRLTAKTDQYRRPDSTIYNLPIGAGAPENGGNVCDKVLMATRNFVVGAWRYGTTSTYTSNNGEYTHDEWIMSHQLIRRDAGRFVYRNRENYQDVSQVFEWTSSPVTYPQVVLQASYQRDPAYSGNATVYSDANITIHVWDWLPQYPNGTPDVLTSRASTVQLTTPPETGW